VSDDATHILAIRHGQTAWNADSRIQGHTDIELDETGHWQAARLADALAGQPLHAVYSSDLARARQTAAPLAERAGLELRIDSGLRERGFGDFEGLSFAQIEHRWPEQASRWRKRDPDFGPQGGETLAAFHSRSMAAITRLASRHPAQVIAVVTHGGVLDTLYRAAARVGPAATRTWLIPNATINRLLYSAEGFAIVGWNDASHLDAGD
jgi:probable phosphoglycerate mutase